MQTRRGYRYYDLLMAAFVAGMMTQTIALRLSLQISKRRLRSKTRQLFEPRTVQLTYEGIEQVQPAVRSLHRWGGIDRIEGDHGLIVIWTGNIVACVIPERAFPTRQDAAAFLEQCRTRAAAAAEP